MRKSTIALQPSSQQINHTYEVRYPSSGVNVIVRCYSAEAALRVRQVGEVAGCGGERMNEFFFYGYLFGLFCTLIVVAAMIVSGRSGGK